jgi:hypothetical protein
MTATERRQIRKKDAPRKGVMNCVIRFENRNVTPCGEPHGSFAASNVWFSAGSLGQTRFYDVSKIPDSEMLDGVVEATQFFRLQNAV